MHIGLAEILAILAIVLVVFEALQSRAISLTQVAVILLALIFLVA